MSQQALIVLRVRVRVRVRVCPLAWMYSLLAPQQALMALRVCPLP
jgi:hypothetical protein